MIKQLREGDPKLEVKIEPIQNDQLRRDLLNANIMMQAEKQIRSIDNLDLPEPLKKKMKEYNFEELCHGYTIEEMHEARISCNLDMYGNGVRPAPRYHSQEQDDYEEGYTPMKQIKDRRMKQVKDSWMSNKQREALNKKLNPNK